MKEPSAIALAHSQALCAQISSHIQASGGKISFADYMQQALYAPGLGYYNAGSSKFGAAGDFVTAPELGSLFAQCVAKQCAQILATIPHGVILEIGAGSGQLACDLIHALQQANVKLSQYLILELSADLKHRQQQKILQECPEFYAQCIWLDKLPEHAINGIIIANEVLDAMPVSKFYFTAGQLQEYYVSVANGIFKEQLGPASDKLQENFFKANIAAYLQDTPQPYTSEINLWLPAWIKSLNTTLNTGAILLFDYGFGRAEYYHPQRATGTLMCHYQQHSHSDPFFYPGLQDITAHVDFTAIAEAAEANALQINGYTNLASFLINCGITNYVGPSLKQAQELNLLTSAAEMGELFKAMILTKMVDLPLVGFSQFDKLHTL